MLKISKTQIQEFNKNGFISFDNFFSKNAFNYTKKNFKKLFYGFYSNKVVPDKIKWRPGRDKNNIPRSLCNIWKSDQTIAKIILNEKLGFAAAKLMGWKSTRLNQDSIIWVVPNAGCINYHQDDPYQDWHIPRSIITCWIPITDTTEKSASIEYLVGSHRKKISKRRKNFYAKSGYRNIIKNYIKKKESIKVMSLKVGSVVFHHGKIWHGSGFNKTSKDRVSLSIHFMDGKSKFHPKIKSPYFNHYKKFNSLDMDESFFPITWSNKGKKTKFIKNYINS